jgi:hypothetical protein
MNVALRVSLELTQGTKPAFFAGGTETAVNARWAAILKTATHSVRDR